MQIEVIAEWVKKHPFSTTDVDCATAVMLKILDGKCKMNPEEKTVMRLLYQAVKSQPSQLLGVEIHTLIANAENNLDDDMKLFIYEKRLLAETMISRPIMKAFKANIRQQGLFTAKG